LKYEGGKVLMAVNWRSRALAREPAGIFDRIPANVTDYREAIRSTSLAPRIVERQTFVAGERMALSGRAGDEHATNAVCREERCLRGNDFRSDAAISVEGRMNGSDEVMKHP
jgi:hypothetical protein